ncbi:integrase [Parageobacillus genomosp. 1]|uniref:Integrase n=1 Tax=Parageobacillus genomosp. 1 TaxID=1295642 RepID=A0ABC9VFA4_9BACL|nr:integrase [Parageobacillus genomosp. 1]
MIMTSFWFVTVIIFALNYLDIHVDFRVPFQANRGQSHMMKIKEPRKKLKVLMNEEIQQLIKATTNIRGRSLIQLLRCLLPFGRIGL